jgi:hypothetical protein
MESLLAAGAGMIFWMLFAIGFVLLVNAGILSWVINMLKVGTSTYRIALKIMFWSFLWSIPINIIIGIIDSEKTKILTTIVAMILSFLAYHWSVKRYFHNTWLQTLVVMAVNAIVAAIVFGIIGFGLFMMFGNILMID